MQAVWITISALSLLAATAATTGPRLEGSQNDQKFPVLKVHLTRDGQEAGLIYVRFPEAIEAEVVGERGVTEFYQDVRSPDWPVELACEPVGLPVKWESTGESAAYAMAFDNGMRLTASAELANGRITLQYTLVNATGRTLRKVGIWSCVQLQLSPELADPLMERTYCWVGGKPRLMRELVPGFQPYPADQAANRRFSAQLAGTPSQYKQNPFIAPHPGHPDDPTQRVWFWSVPEPISRAAIATAARDQTWAVVTESARAVRIWTNPGISCHHADPIGDKLAPGGTLTSTTTVRIVEGAMPGALSER